MPKLKPLGIWWNSVQCIKLPISFVLFNLPFMGQLGLLDIRHDFEKFLHLYHSLLRLVTLAAASLPELECLWYEKQLITITYIACCPRAFFRVMAVQWKGFVLSQFDLHQLHSFGLSMTLTHDLKKHAVWSQVRSAFNTLASTMIWQKWLRIAWMSTFGVSAPATLLSSWEKPFGRCGAVPVLGCVGALASRLLRGGKAGERPDSFDEQFSGTSGMVSLQRPLWIGHCLWSHWGVSCLGIEFM